MRIGLFTNSHSVNGGGGVPYLSGWAQALRDFGTVDLLFPTEVSTRDLSEFCGLDLSGVSVGQAQRQKRLGLGQIRMERSYDLVVRQAVTAPRPTFCGKAVLVTDFPLQKEITWRERQYIRSYSAVVANSIFTSECVARRWGRNATVIHPPVRQVAARSKMPWIVSVGRFTAGGRSKHQLDMVLNFRRLLEAGLSGWELHVCGASDDQLYLDKVREAASGLPVRIHISLPRQELDDIIGCASIFWHATGINSSERDNPESMEHFGISTGEAMAAGCVPIVVGRGGLKEVVGTALLEWTWQSWEECVEKTRVVANNVELRQGLAEKARRQAESFAFTGFQSRVQHLVRGVMNGAL